MPTIQNRRATAAQWTAANPVLAAGELGFELDTNSAKIGDGLTPWETLPYLSDESLSELVETGRLSEAALNDTYGADAWEDADSEVRQIAKTKFVGQVKTSRGAAVPEFMRHPTLGVERVWPNTYEDVTLLWTSVDGETVYAQDQGGYFLKSTNGGRTWSSRQLIPPQPGGTLRRLGRQGAFLRLKNGTLLSVPRVDNAIGPAMYFARSTDDGVTWTYVDVRTLTAGGTHLGPTSWCEDPVTGYVYYGEYDPADTQAEVNVYRSTDSGATWSKFHTFPGPATSHADKVRHIHSVEWDHIAQRILITTGDPEPAAGIYRVNAAGTGVEPLLLNRQITNAYTHDGTTPFTQSARAIGIMPFPDYIAYAADSQLAALVRVPRSALVTDGVTPVDVEVVKYLNSTAWFAIRASNDGSRWVMSASQEGASTRIDPAAHLYAVEDQGATIYELGTWLSPSAASWVSISPVGDAQSSGDTFYLRAHNSPRPAAWRCSLLASSGSPLPLPPTELKRAWTWQNFTTPQTTLEPGETLVFGFQRVPAGASALMVYDMGVLRLSGAYGTVARIQSVDGATVYATAGGPSERANSQVAPSEREAFSRAPAPGSDVVFVMHNTSATEPVTALAFITVGWGSFAGDLAG